MQMAKVVMPLNSMEVRGKLGGIIFNTHRGISVAKAFKSPTQPNSAAQTNARTRLTNATRAWAALTADQRAQWEVFANDHLEPDWTGKPKRLSGHNMYCRINTRLALVSGAAVSVPPTAAAPASPANLTVTFVAGAPAVIRMNYSSAIPANISRVAYIQGPISQGRKNRFEFAKIAVQKVAADASPQTVVSGPGAGKWGVWVQDISTVTGLASGFQFVEVTAS
jgi:hypothetical protein